MSPCRPPPPEPAIARRRDLPGLRLRLRRHRRGGPGWPDRRGSASLRARRGVVRRWLAARQCQPRCTGGREGRADARRPSAWWSRPAPARVSRAGPDERGGSAKAVALADVLGAALDSVTSSTAMGCHPRRAGTWARVGHAGRGAAARRRRGVVGRGSARPLSALLRRATRRCAGLHVPEGRSSRTVIAVDMGDAAGSGRRRSAVCHRRRTTKCRRSAALRALAGEGTPARYTRPRRHRRNLRAGIWARARALRRRCCRAVCAS